MNKRFISTNTLAVFGAAVALVVLIAVLIALEVGGDAGVVAVADIGEVLVVGLAAVVILMTARRLGPTSSVGRPWLLMGLGALSYTVGDIVWTVIEVGLGREVPYPGVPDFFYLLEYPLVAVGVLSAGLAFRGLVDIRRPAIIATVTGLATSAAVYFGLLAPFVLFDPEVALGEKLLSALYPVGDVALMFTTSVFVVAVVASLGGGRLAWPWWAVAAGALLIALADTGYAWLSVYDLYESGSVIDYGWSLGHAFMMLGALISRDLATTRHT